MENTATSSAKRYVVYMVEQLSYRVEILAKDEEEAKEIALATEMKGDPDTLSFDIDEVNELSDENKMYFSAINECERCHRQNDNFETEMYCPNCE